MKQRFMWLMGLALGAMALSAEAQAPDLQNMDIVLKSVPDGPVANVRGSSVEARDFADTYLGELERLKHASPDAELDDRTRIAVGLRVLRLLIQREVLYQDALTENITVSDADVEASWKNELERFRQALKKESGETLTEAQILEKTGGNREDVLAELRKVILIDRMQERIVESSNITVPESEIKEIFEKNKGDGRRPDIIHFKQIYKAAPKEGVGPTTGAVASRRRNSNEVEADRKRAEKTANDALRRIKSGQNFAAVAKEMSDGASAANGGDMGEVPIAQVPPFLVEAARKLQPGQTSGVIASDYGYHIVELVKFVPGAEFQLDDVRPQIERILKAERGAQAIDEYCAKVIADTDKVKMYLELEKQLATRPDILKELAAES
jgi:hypothetical protein